MTKNIKINRFSSKEVNLFFINKLNSKIKNLNRVFFLVSKKKCVRGNHAHKVCAQYLISIKGNIKIEKEHFGKISKTTILEFKEIVKIKPKTWLKVHMKRNQILCVFCDKDFDQKEYIHNYKDFKKIKK